MSFATMQRVERMDAQRIANHRAISVKSFRKGRRAVLYFNH